MAQLSRKTSRFDSEKIAQNTFLPAFCPPPQFLGWAVFVRCIPAVHSRRKGALAAETLAFFHHLFSSLVLIPVRVRRRAPQETLAKFKRLLSLARRSIEENQRQITEKDGQISALREALGAAENARRRYSYDRWFVAWYVEVEVTRATAMHLGTPLLGTGRLARGQMPSSLLTGRRPSCAVDWGIIRSPPAVSHGMSMRQATHGKG